MDQEKLDAILKRIDKLPTLPQTSQRILSAIEGEASAGELEKIITEDQALAAKLLKLANSPLYAPPQPITNLQNAIVRLGFGEVRNVVLASALNYLLKPQATYKKFNLARLWIHALGVARATFLLAKEENYADAETLYTAGLLHDLGRLALAVFFPEYFLHVLAVQEAKENFFWEAEQEVGIAHTEIGALIAEHWRFSEALVSARIITNRVKTERSTRSPFSSSRGISWPARRVSRRRKTSRGFPNGPRTFPSTRKYFHEWP